MFFSVLVLFDSHASNNCARYFENKALRLVKKLFPQTKTDQFVSKSNTMAKKLSHLDRRLPALVSKVKLRNSRFEGPDRFWELGRIDGIIAFSQEKNLHSQVNRHLETKRTSFVDIENSPNSVDWKAYSRLFPRPLRYDASPRTKEINKKYDFFQVAAVIASIKWAMSHAPIFRGYLYRGEIYHGKFRLPKVGDTVLFKRFISTSLDPDEALGFSNLLRSAEAHVYANNEMDYMRSFEQQRDEFIEETYGEAPQRVFTVFDLRKKGVLGLYMPSIYSAGGVKHELTEEKEVLLNTDLRFLVSSQKEMMDFGGRKFVLRVLVPLSTVREDVSKKSD